jgi:hypothetical protein
MRRLALHPERLALALAALAWAWMVGHAAVAHRFACCASTPSWPEDLLGWTAMVAAMMVPARLAQLRDVAARSYRARRLRAVVAYLLGYFAWWVALGIAVCTARGLAVPLPGATAFAVLAAGWALLPIRERWHRRCHRRIPLYPLTWRADLSAFHQGAVNGAPCAAMCWPLMVACTITNHNLIMMVVCTALVAFESRMRRLRRAPLVLGALGVAVLTLAC